MRQIDVPKVADEARFNGFHRRLLFLCALIIIFDGYDLTVASTIGTQLIAYAYVGQYYPAAVRSTGIGWVSGVGRLGAWARSSLPSSSAGWSA